MMGLFSTCIKGHDLTGTDAYVYRGSGLRECRSCVQLQKKKKSSGDSKGWVNHYTG